jgi:hypothetical protein
VSKSPELQRRELLMKTRQALPHVTMYFCGSCGVHDRSQDHAPDCVWEDRKPRVAVRYVPQITDGEPT